MDQADLDRARDVLHGLYEREKGDLERTRAKLDKSKEEAEKEAVTTQEGKMTDRKIKQEVTSLRGDIGHYEQHKRTIRSFLEHADELEALIAKRTRLDCAITYMGDQFWESIAALEETYDEIRSRRASTQPSSGKSEATEQTSDRTEQALHSGASSRSISKPAYGDKRGSGYRHSNQKGPSSRGK